MEALAKNQSPIEKEPRKTSGMPFPYVTIPNEANIKM
jgi:hypothetical protein